MKVAIGTEEVKVKISVGDIVQFDHKGTAGQHGFYLVCHDEDEGYFIMNLSGKKRRIAYYSTLGNLLFRHQASIKNVFPADEFQITLTRMEE